MPMVGLALTVGLLSTVGCGKKAEMPYGPGGKWIDDMRARITNNVEDPDKSIKLLEQVDEMEIVLMELDQYLTDYYNRLTLLDENYNSTREEFQEEIDAFNKYRHNAVEKLFEITVEMKKIAGRADWAAISDMDETLYESWQRSYDS
jgi:hypothetical protein